MPKTVIKAMNVLLALDNTDLEMNILHPLKKSRMSMGNEIESSDSILDSLTNSLDNKKSSKTQFKLKGYVNDIVINSYLINNENVITYTHIYGNKMHTIDFLILQINEWILTGIDNKAI